MGIQERIDKLQPHVIGIRFTNGMWVVDAVFNEGWTVPSSKVISAARDENSGIGYFMFFTEREDLGTDDVLDFIEKVITLNIEREKKFQLLKVKIEELKDVFKQNTLSSLENMKFILGGEQLISNTMTEDFDEITIDDVQETQEVIKEEPVEEPKAKSNDLLEGEHNVKPTNIEEPVVKKATAKNQAIELPPKKVELEEHEEPVVVCNCLGDDMCPVCYDEKMA